MTETHDAPPFDPAFERKLAAGIHLGGIAVWLLAPAALLPWHRRASPWLRRHARDAAIHWALVLALLVGSLALDSMNPVYDFGIARAALYHTLGITRIFLPVAWATSAVFAFLSARRALRGQASFYPFTLWWSAPHPAPPPLEVETLELDPRDPPNR